VTGLKIGHCFRSAVYTEKGAQKVQGEYLKENQRHQEEGVKARQEMTITQKSLVAYEIHGNLDMADRRDFCKSGSGRGNGDTTKHHRYDQRSRNARDDTQSQSLYLHLVGWGEKKVKTGGGLQRWVGGN